MFLRKNREDKGKPIIKITQAVIQVADTLCDYNFHIFDELVLLATNYGIDIDNEACRSIFMMGVLVPETLYSFQVFPSQKANLICDLTEKYIASYDYDDEYHFGINGETLYIKGIELSKAFYVFENSYIEYEKEFLQDKIPSKLPINRLLIDILATILGCTENDVVKGIYAPLFRLCSERIRNKGLTLWKTICEGVAIDWEH